MSMPSSTRSSPEERPAESTGRSSPLAHLVLNGAMALLFGALFLRAGELPSSMWEPLGAGSFPRLVLVLLVLINLAIIVKEGRAFVVSPSAKRGIVARWAWSHRLAFGVLGLFALFIVAVPWLGFAWASLAFLILGQWLLGARSLKALVIAVAIALVFSFGVDTLFREVFVISLPRGPLG